MTFEVENIGQGFPRSGELILRKGGRVYLVTSYYTSKEKGLTKRKIDVVYFGSLSTLSIEERKKIKPVKIIGDPDT